MKMSNLIHLILGFSILGLISAGYTSYAHFNNAAYEVCTFGESFSCNVVNQSEYSSVAGIPVAFLGLGVYLFFIGFALYYRKKQDERLLMIASALALAGLVFSLYLTSIEAFVLYTWCLFCIFSQISILGITIAILYLRKLTSHQQP